MPVKLQKTIFFIFLIFPCLLWGDFPAIPKTNLPPPSPPGLGAKSYLLIDFKSDHVIVERDADLRVDPASLTKMMTVYVVDQAIKAKRISPHDTVHISERAWRAPGSRMFLNVNSNVPVEELIKGIIIQSGNDASIAIAEHIAGSEEAFAGIMNHYAQELGMKDTHFMNATGLPDPVHYTTARDMARLAKAIIRDFPETYKIYSQREFTFQNIKQPNRNRLLWQHDWVDGIKTGHTDSAGFCLVASGNRDDMRLISVLMGAQNDKDRVSETDKLLNYGFQFFETRKLYPKGLALKQSRIWMGQEKEIEMGVPDDVYVTLIRGQGGALQAVIQNEKVIKAPIQEGAPLGKIVITLDNKTIAEKPIVALKAIGSAGFFGRIYDSIALTFQTLWEKVFA